MMRYMNKITCITFILVGSLCSFLFPGKYQLTYFTSFLTVTAFLLGILIYRFKQVQLVAGVVYSELQSDDQKIKMISNYIGKLMFITGTMLGTATILSFYNEKLYDSWIMMIFAIPIIVYGIYSYIKINVKL